MLQEKGWTWDFGQGLDSTYYLTPGVRKSTGVLGKDMFAGEAQVRNFLSRESGGRDERLEGVRHVNGQIHGRRTRGKNTNDYRGVKEMGFVTLTAKGTRLSAVEVDGEDDEMSPLEILKKRRSHPPQTSMAGDAETQDQYHKV